MKNLLLVLSILISASAFGQVGEKNFIDQNYIEVTAKAEMEVAPDQIFLKIQVDEKNFKGKKLADIEASMLAKLKDLGIDTKKDLSVKDLVSNFRSYWILKSDIQLAKEYQLLVRDAKLAGKVFAELQTIGISGISIERVDNSKLLDYKKEVKVNAIKAAQDKAKALTAAIGQTVGKAIYIQEIDNGYYNPMEGRAAGLQVRGVNSLSSAYEASEPDIEFEKIKLEYSILVRFELK